VRIPPAISQPRLIDKASRAVAGETLVVIGRNLQAIPDEKASSFLNISFPQRRFENSRRNAPDLARSNNSRVFAYRSNPTRPWSEKLSSRTLLEAAVRFSVERENESDRVLGHRKG
jgi:hypothetical protein